MKDHHAGQHFISDAQLAHYIVSLAQLSGNETVYDIGAGFGALTLPLARKAKWVVAIEKDPRIAAVLAGRLTNYGNVRLIVDDALSVRLDSPDAVVVSNPPFSLSSSLVRRILDAQTVSRAVLVLQLDAIARYAGIGRSTLFSVLAFPYHELRKISAVPARAFLPPPGVRLGLLSILRRSVPLIRANTHRLFQGMVSLGFGRARANVRQNLKNVFTSTQWRRLSRQHAFNARAMPSDLRAEQWVGLLDFVVEARAKRQLAIPSELWVAAAGHKKSTHLSSRAA